MPLTPAPENPCPTAGVSPLAAADEADVKVSQWVACPYVPWVEWPLDPTSDVYLLEVQLLSTGEPA